MSQCGGGPEFLPSHLFGKVGVGFFGNLRAGSFDKLRVGCFRRWGGGEVLIAE
jgi:hypothetical protein